MSSTSHEPTVVQGNNLLQGYKDVDKRKTNKNKESNETEGNTEENGAGQEKTSKSYEIKFWQVPNESSYSPKIIHIV